jgi:hypothetical protein
VAADVVPLVLMHEPERAEGEATDAFLEEAESCLMTLRLMSYDRRIRDLAAEITAADRAGDDALRDRLVAESREHVLQFDWTDVARRTEALYDDLRAANLKRAGHRSGT